MLLAHREEVSNAKVDVTDRKKIREANIYAAAVHVTVYFGLY